MKKKMDDINCLSLLYLLAAGFDAPIDAAIPTRVHTRSSTQVDSANSSKQETHAVVRQRGKCLPIPFEFRTHTSL